MSAILQHAVDHHRAGRLTEALALYRRVLDSQPDNPDALNLGGAACLQTGNVETAIDWLSRAVAEQPTFADAYNNLGTALEAAGRGDEAASTVCANQEIVSRKPPTVFPRPLVAPQSPTS